MHCFGRLFRGDRFDDNRCLLTLMNSPDALLYKVSDVSLAYSTSNLERAKRPVQVLNSVSLSVYSGEVLGIVGGSGSGKSTLAKLLLGLIQPTEGHIEFNGQPLSTVSRTEFTRCVMPVFQDPYSSLNPRKTIAQIVGLPLDVHRIGSPQARQARVKEVLDRVGLPSSFLHRYPNQLSGGQRQRAAIARALVTSPKVLICDEPTWALDVSVQSQVINLLIDLRQAYALTYIFISHNLAVVEHIATRIAVMRQGEIVECGDTQSVFARPAHRYTQELLACILPVTCPTATSAARPACAWST